MDLEMAADGAGQKGLWRFLKPPLLSFVDNAGYFFIQIGH